MTHKNTVETSQPVDDTWLSTPRITMPSTETLQQQIIQRAQAIEQQAREPVSHHQAWYQQWRGLLWGITAPAVLTIALVVFINFQPGAMLYQPDAIVISDTISHAEWEDYFLLEDEVLLSSL